MSRAPKKPPLALDMGFGEALTRFAKVDPNEIKEKRPRKKIKPRQDGVKDTDAI